MSTIYVTTDGFQKKTYEVLKAEYEAVFQSIFGSDVDLDPSGPVGQFVAKLAQKDSDIWDMLEEIYQSRDPDSAEGISLDKVAAETGILRQASSPTTVLDAHLLGTNLTVVPAGSRVRQSSGEYTTVEYTLDTDVTITTTNATKIELSIFTPVVNGRVYDFGIGALSFSHTATVPGEDENDVALALKAQVDASAFTGTCIVVGGTITLEDVGASFSFAKGPFVTLDLIGSPGDFTADTAGAIPLPAGTLDTIVTSVAGWTDVENTNSGITGRDEETDSDFRIRRAATITTGNATEDAFIRNISNNVTGITFVSILSNRTDVIDGNGLPPHSFECIVEGGTNSDIAQQIWLTQAAGIASHGSETEIVVDSQGQNQTVYFSRPTSVYIHVKVRRKLYSEEIYPVNGDDLIKDAIVEWALLYQPISKDVIRQRLASPIYSVDGIGEIEITIDGTPNPGDTPTYATQDIAINARERADFDITRIIVETLP